MIVSGAPLTPAAAPGGFASLPPAGRIQAAIIRSARGRHGVRVPGTVSG